MQYNILGFDVPMDNLARVQFSHRLADLPYDAGNLGLRHRLKFFQLLEELSPHSNLHQDVDIDSIIEEAIHPDDIWMV